MGYFSVWGPPRANPLPCLWSVGWFVAEQKSSHAIDETATSGLTFPNSPNAKATRQQLFHSQRAVHSTGCDCQACLGSRKYMEAPQVERGRKGQIQYRGRKGSCHWHKQIFIIIKKKGGITVLLSSFLWWSKIKWERRVREMIASQTTSNLARVYLSVAVQT